MLITAHLVADAMACVTTTFTLAAAKVTHLAVVVLNDDESERFPNSTRTVAPSAGARSRCRWAPMTRRREQRDHGPSNTYPRPGKERGGGAGHKDGDTVGERGRDDAQRVDEPRGVGRGGAIDAVGLEGAAAHSKCQRPNLGANGDVVREVRDGEELVGPAEQLEGAVADGGLDGKLRNARMRFLPGGKLLKLVG